MGSFSARDLKLVIRRARRARPDHVERNRCHHEPHLCGDRERGLYKRLHTTTTPVALRVFGRVGGGGGSGSSSGGSTA